MTSLYIVVLTIIIILIGNSYKKYTEVKKENQTLQKRLENYNQDEQRLLDEIKKLEDENYLNMKLNEQYLESNKGGIIFILPEDE